MTLLSQDVAATHAADENSATEAVALAKFRLQAPRVRSAVDALAAHGASRPAYLALIAVRPLASGIEGTPATNMGGTRFN